MLGACRHRIRFRLRLRWLLKCNFLSPILVSLSLLWKYLYCSSHWFSFSFSMQDAWGNPVSPGSSQAAARPPAAPATGSNLSQMVNDPWAPTPSKPAGPSQLNYAPHFHEKRFFFSLLRLMMMMMIFFDVNWAIISLGSVVIVAIVFFFFSLCRPASWHDFTATTLKWQRSLCPF